MRQVTAVPYSLSLARHCSNTMLRWLLTVLVALALGLPLAPAQPTLAALGAVGPVNAQNGFPTWYRDSNGLTLELGLDPALNLFDPPIPGNAFSEQIGFGGEGFYWIAESAMAMPAAPALPAGGNAFLRLALEYAFANEDPAVGDQMVFQRVRIRADAPVAGRYTVTHPYGVAVLDVPAGPRTINSTIDVGGLALDFAGALSGPIAPFITAVDPAPPAGFVGNGPLGAEHTVTGSPFGTNFFRVQGPNIDVRADLFMLSGKILAEAPPPAEQPPAEQPPAQQPPAEQPPAQQPPAEQPPAQQPPTQQSPVITFTPVTTPSPQFSSPPPPPAIVVVLPPFAPPPADLRPAPPGATQIRATGVVRSIQGNIWTIGPFVVTVDGSTQLGGDPSMGKEVEVWIDVLPEGRAIAVLVRVRGFGGPATATPTSTATVAPTEEATTAPAPTTSEPALSQAAMRLQLSGQVRLIQGNVWTVGSFVVTVGDSTQLVGSPAPGSQVTVQVLVQPDGTVITSSITATG